MQEIGRRCSIVRLPGAFSTHFLMTLTPDLTRNYKHMAIVLDDALAPTHGDSPVNASKLLQKMQEHSQYRRRSRMPSGRRSNHNQGGVWANSSHRNLCSNIFSRVVPMLAILYGVFQSTRLLFRSLSRPTAVPLFESVSG